MCALGGRIRPQLAKHPVKGVAVVRVHVGPGGAQAVGEGRGSLGRVEKVLGSEEMIGIIRARKGHRHHRAGREGRGRGQRRPSRIQGHDRSDAKSIDIVEGVDPVLAEEGGGPLQAGPGAGIAVPQERECIIKGRSPVALGTAETKHGVVSVRQETIRVAARIGPHVGVHVHQEGCRIDFPGPTPKLRIKPSSCAELNTPLAPARRHPLA